MTLKVKLCDPHVLARDLYIFIVRERQRYRFAHCERLLFDHINANATEFRQRTSSAR